MTDGGSAFQPGRDEGTAPPRPRGAFVAHEVFGHGEGAVLVEPEVARDLRTAAEFASQERRVAGGLLYGRAWSDDEGRYLVVDGFLGAGPGENRGDQLPAEGRDSFALSDADLRLLRADAARNYPSALEVGWWRSLPVQGGFGPRDFESQRELVGPGGVGLLVFGSGLDWGTAYLGPDGQVPGSARSFIPVPRPAEEPSLLQVAGPAPTLELDTVPNDGTVPADDPGDDPADDLDPVAAGDPDGGRRALPPQTGPRVISPVRVPAKEWGGAQPPRRGRRGYRTPTDVRIVVVLLAIVIIAAAVMIGALFNSVLVAVILALVGLVIGGAVFLAARP